MCKCTLTLVHAGSSGREPACKCADFVFPMILVMLTCMFCCPGAFAAVAAVESAYMMQYGMTPDLSEQQVLSCCNNTNGCNGGSAGGGCTQGYPDFVSEGLGHDACP